MYERGKVRKRFVGSHLSREVTNEGRAPQRSKDYKVRQVGVEQRYYHFSNIVTWAYC